MSDLPMLSEHQAPNKIKTSEETYAPSDDEKKLISKLDKMFQKAKRQRARVDYNWIDFYRLFRGDQWKEQRPSYRASEVFNLIFQTIQSQIPIITDSKPKFEYLPQDPSDREFADLMNDVAASDWQRKNWLFCLTEVLQDSHLYGTGLSSLRYCPKKMEIDYQSADPFYFFPDPSAKNLEDECAYTVYAEPMDVSRVKALAGDKAKYIKADVTDLMSAERIDLANSRFRSPFSDEVVIETSGYVDVGSTEVLLKTFYLQDEEVIEEEKENEGGDKSYVQKLKYPCGRKVVIANDVILHDGPNEYDDHKFPYQRLINYINSRQFWGISELEPLASPQRVFNKLVSYVIDVLVLMGNPIWVCDTTAEIDTQNLTNQPGLVVEKMPGSEVRREAGVPLQPYVLSVIDKLKEWFEQLSGSQDITRGIAAGGVTANAAIENLQNAAQTRIRQKMRHLDAYLQDFGQQYASRVMQFYTAPQVFRLTGKDGTEKYFKMHIDKRPTDEGHAHVAVVQRYTDNGQLSPNIEEYQLRGNLDVRVTTGSSLPFSKVQNEQRLFSLYDRQLVDEEEVLKGLDYPNWEAVLQRKQEKQAALAAQQVQNPQQPVAN